MKPLSRIYYLFFIFPLLLFSSCADETEDPFADPVDKFLGHWKANETSTLYGPGYVYDVNIKRNPSNSAEILISNFYMQGEYEVARALVTASSLTIMEQTICEGTITVKGSGQYVQGKINLSYSVMDGADQDQVTAIYVRR